MKFAVLLVAAAVAGCSAPAITIDATNGMARVEFAGEPFATVHYEATPRPYLWPVYGPDGTALTRSYPMADAPGEARDHPHHRSLWFAHGDVNGYDFWAGRGRNERIEFGARLLVSHGTDHGTVEADYFWMAEEDVHVCTERRRITFRAAEGVRAIDFEITLTPGEAPVVFGDTKEGTLAMRLHPALRPKGEVAAGAMRNSEGVEGQACWGKRARWIEYHGPVEGRHVGVALFDHPANLRHPTWWHAREYGLVAANPFGIHRFEEQEDPTLGDLRLEPGEILTLRYRILLHTGAWDPEELDRAWEDWIAE